MLAKNIDKLKGLMATHEIAILSLDHDLGTNPSGQLLPTGYDFVKWFCEEGLFAALSGNQLIIMVQFFNQQ